METDTQSNTAETKTSLAMATPDFSYVCKHHLLPFFVAEKCGDSIRDFRVIWLNVVARSLFSACLQRNQTLHGPCDDWLNTRLEDFLSTIFRSKDVVESYFELLDVAAGCQASLASSNILPKEKTGKGPLSIVEPIDVDIRDSSKRFQIYATLQDVDQVSRHSALESPLPIIGCRSIKQGGFRTNSGKRHQRTADLTSLLWIDPSNRSCILGIQGTMPLTNEQVQDALAKEDPLQYFWNNSDDWFSENHNEVPHEFQKVIEEQFNRTDRWGMKGYPYEYAIKDKLGLRFPATARRGKNWKEMNNFHESLKRLTGTCYNGNAFGDDVHNLNLGSVLLLSLIAIKSIGTLPTLEKFLQFPDVSQCPFAALQKPMDAKKLAEAIFKLFTCFYERGKHGIDLADDIESRFRFSYKQQEGGNPGRLIYYLPFSASKRSSGRLEPLASLIPQFVSDNDNVNSASGAVSRAVHYIHKGVSGYGTGGRIILHEGKLIFEAVPDFLKGN